MIFMNLPRGGGKTALMIEWLRGTRDSVMITHSFQKQQRLWERYPDLKEQIRYFDPRLSLKGQFFKNIAVDNADLILENILRRPIQMMSISEPEHELLEWANPPQSFVEYCKQLRTKPKLLE